MTRESRDPRIRETGRPDPTKGGFVPDPVHELAIVCTDKGQHKRIRLTTARWFSQEGRPVLDGAHGTQYQPDWRHTWRLLGPGGALPTTGETRVIEFSCPRCPRRPRRLESDVMTLLEAARRSTLPEIDVSRLD